jgi:hypothetical protein
MDKDRLKLALRENLSIKLQTEPIEEADTDIYGNVYGVRKIGDRVKVTLYWKETGEVLTEDEIGIKKYYG